MQRTSVISALAVGALGIGVTACGSSSSGGVSASGSTAPGVTTVPSGGATTEAVTTTTSVTTPTSGPLAKQPVITLPKTKAPTTLVKKDIVTGTGQTAASGDELTVNYVGELYTNGKIFDSSWKDTPGKGFGPFQLGAGAVIKGWDQGLVGMKVGGRRELIIPPSLAYGATGSGSTIPPNSTLIFEVDLLAVQKGSSASAAGSASSGAASSGATSSGG